MVAGAVATAWPAWSACPGSRAWPVPRPSRTWAPTARRSPRRWWRSVATTGNAARWRTCRPRTAGSATGPAPSSGRCTPGQPPAAVTGRFVVLGVTFRLERSARSAPVRYGELARALGISEGDRAPLAQVRSAVLALRRGKGMVLDAADPDTRSAGSFFTNPVLDRRSSPSWSGPWPRLRAAGPDPRYPAGPGGSRCRPPGSSSGPVSPRATGRGRTPRARGSPPSTPWRWSTRAAPARPTCSRWPGRSPTACARRSAWTWPPNRSWSRRTLTGTGGPLGQRPGDQLRIGHVAVVGLGGERVQRPGHPDRGCGTRGQQPDPVAPDEQQRSVAAPDRAGRTGAGGGQRPGAWPVGAGDPEPGRGWAIAGSSRG